MKIFLYECVHCFSFKELDKENNTVYCNYRNIYKSLPVLVDDNGWKYVECPKEGLIVKVVKNKDAELPFYATPNSSGFDLIASQDITLRPNNRKLIPTGLRFEIPEGYEVQIRPRSGLSLKTPLVVANSPGTIDSDYRGEIKVILWNTNTSKSYAIKKGDRIAQGILAKVERAQFVVVKEISKTSRGEGGFGHTGKSSFDWEELDVASYWNELDVICPKCGWEGKWKERVEGEIAWFCPKCSAILSLKDDVL